MHPTTRWGPWGLYNLIMWHWKNIVFKSQGFFDPLEHLRLTTATFMGRVAKTAQSETSRLSPLVFAVHVPAVSEFYRLRCVSRPRARETHSGGKTSEKWRRALRVSKACDPRWVRCVLTAAGLVCFQLGCVSRGGDDFVTFASSRRSRSRR